MSIPIAGTTPIEDPQYRYQMPPLQRKIEGRGNGIKTVIVNMANIADAIHRDPAEITKFFGCELGTISNWNTETDKSVVNGAHETRELQDYLSRYIEDFVLCPTCGLPETKYKIKNGIVFHKCCACGAKEPLNMTHKLATFIINQHKRAKEMSKKDKKEKKKKKEKADNDEAREKEKEKKKKSKKKKKRKKEKKKTSSGSDEHEGSDSNANGNDNAKEEGLDENGEVTETLGNLENDDANALEMGAESLKVIMDAEPPPTISTIVEEVRNIQTYSVLPAPNRIHIFVLAAFDADVVLNGNQVEKHSAVLKELIGQNIDMQRHAIGAVEYFCARKFPELVPKIAIVLKHFYDNDILGEQPILDWGKDACPRSLFSYPCLSDAVLADLKKAAEPFILWLERAEEDSDSDADDDDDDDDDNDDDDNDDDDDDDSNNNDEDQKEDDEEGTDDDDNQGDDWIDDL